MIDHLLVLMRYHADRQASMMLTPEQLLEVLKYQQDLIDSKSDLVRENNRLIAVVRGDTADD